MGRSWRIGTAFGIGLYVHWSFLLIPALVLFSQSKDGLGAALAGTSLVFALFGCVLLHELGHALMARTFGIGTRDITLYPIGGVARLEGMGNHPLQEMAIAVAGPAVNVVIAAGLWLGLQLAGALPLGHGPEDILASTSPVEFGLMVLLSANLMLVLFNIIPAFPMDGGRVFRAFLALFVGRLRATEIAVGVAKVIAAVFILGGLIGWQVPWVDFQMTPMLSVIGVFLLIAGGQELAMLRYQEYARRRGLSVDPRQAAPLEVVEPADLPWGQPAEPGFSGFTWDPRAGVWIEWRNGRAVGACSVGPTSRPW